MVKTSPCSHKLPMQKGIWNDQEEDENVTTFASKQGKGMRRSSGKSSRTRWNINSNNEKKADPRHKSFTPQEEELIIKLHSAIGSRWAIIAQQIPGRSEHDVKTLWNSKLRKKLSAMGIDPVTHRPFSQILADYGNIGTFPKSSSRFNSSRDLKNVVVLNNNNPQQSPQNYNNNNTAAVGVGAGLYSQLQAINLVPNCCYNTGEIISPSSEEVSSFSWSDFLLEDAAFLPNNNEEGQDGNNNGNIRVSQGGEEKKKKNNGFDEATSSTSTFVEAMLLELDRKDEQEEMLFPHLCGFDEDTFYYY